MSSESATLLEMTPPAALADGMDASRCETRNATFGCETRNATFGCETQNAAFGCESGTCVEHLPLWNQKQLDEHLEASLEHWDGRSDLWVFAYGSLIWKPEIAAVETRRARIYGYHRSLCLWSTVNRGTPASPGLVLALDAGGSCEGLAFRVEAAQVRTEFCRLWRREMMRGSYIPTWLGAHTSQGRVDALAFVMDRTLATYAGRLSDDDVVDALRRGKGACGTSADYLLSTVAALDSHGLTDHRLAHYRQLYERLGA